MSSKPHRTARVCAARALAMGSDRVSGFRFVHRMSGKRLWHYALRTVVLSVAGRQNFPIALAGDQRRGAAIRFRLFCLPSSSMAQEQTGGRVAFMRPALIAELRFRGGAQLR